MDPLKPKKKKVAKKRFVSAKESADSLPATMAQREFYRSRTGRDLGEGVTRGMAGCAIQDAMEDLSSGTVVPITKSAPTDRMRELVGINKDLKAQLDSSDEYIRALRKDFDDTRKTIVAERDLLMRLVQDRMNGH